MDPLASWTRGEHTAPVRGTPTAYPTYRKGAGPGVVVVHEIPGPTPAVIGFGEELVGAGYTVVMPHLFGTPGAPFGAASAARSIARVCIRAEFTKLATGVTTPVAGWLRSLAAALHAVGLRYASDRAVGTRFDTLEEAIGDAFIRVDLEGRGHSTVTEHRQQVAVDRVLAFLDERLRRAA